MPRELAHILVGDHLGQVKKILLPSYDISKLTNCTTPDIKNPVASIEQIGQEGSSQLIANANGELRIYNPIHDEVKELEHSTCAGLVKAIPGKGERDIYILHEKSILIHGKGQTIKNKKGSIKGGCSTDDKLAIVGENIPCVLYDINTKNRVFTADPPDKDWLGISPEVFVSDADFIDHNKIVTCSKSDAIIRVYDPRSGKTKPIIQADCGQEAFNEHAEAGRFITVCSTKIDGHCVIAGSNVGQILAIDLRLGVKVVPKKKFQPKTWKCLGSFKGSRGASIKDIKIVPHVFDPSDESRSGYKVISCCCDRYLRIHNFTKRMRTIDKEIYVTTRPVCCSPVFYC